MSRPHLLLRTLLSAPQWAVHDPSTAFSVFVESTVCQSEYWPPALPCCLLCRRTEIPRLSCCCTGSNLSLWPSGARAGDSVPFPLCMCAAYMICMLLGFQRVPRLQCRLCVRSSIMTWSMVVSLSEEPDVVHPAEMRKDCVSWSSPRLPMT